MQGKFYAEAELWISGSSLVVLIIQTVILVKCRANNMRLWKRKWCVR